MTSLTVTALTAAVVFGNVFACASAELVATQEKVRVPFVTVEKGFNSGIRERKLVVIKSAKEWQDVWQAHSSIRVPPQPIPSVDFDKEMIVAVFSGEKRSGGYGIEITKIEADSTKRQLLVFVRETQPPPGSMLIQSLTQPFDIVKTNTTGLPVTFVSEQ